MPSPRRMRPDARLTSTHVPAALQTAPTTACAWCGRPFDDEATRLAGRVTCPRCGVATTEPWPTDAELERAYASWYRPAGGRFVGLGDALLRARAAGWHAPRRDRAARAGARRRRRRRRAARRARRARPRRRSGSSASADRAATSAPASSPSSTGAARRSSSGTRSSTCATPATRSAHAARLLAPRRRARGRGAQRRRACRRARSAIAGWRSTCRAISSTSRRRALLARLRDARPAGRARQPPARRPGGLRLAARAGRPAARPPGPLRRDPPAGGARRADVARPRGAARSLAAVAARSVAAALARRLEVAAAPRRQRLRRGARGDRARAGAKVDRRDAGAATRRETLERTVERDPARVGRRGDPRRRQVHRRTVEVARELAVHVDLAPAQRRLRRQPEDLLPRGAAARAPTSW